MEVFLDTALSFPTVLFSFLLSLAVLFWVTAILGLFEIDVLDSDLGVDMDMDVDFNADIGGDAMQPEGLAGLLMKLGLAGVPVTVVLTLLFFFAWFVCYFVQLLVFGPLSLGWTRYPLGAGVAIVALMVAIPIASIMCRPLRPLFRRLEGPSHKSILGQTAVVRSGRVTPLHGEAVLNDGGAGLILKIRAAEESGFTRGDRVVLLEYLEGEHAYRVISEDEFKGF